MSNNRMRTAILARVTLRQAPRLDTGETVIATAWSDV
jgi:hypothetical protein